VELLGELGLPLFSERAGNHDEATSEVAPHDELADEEPGHDRLARARVVGEEEAEWLARQHRLIDRGDLVRQRLDEARAHRDVRVEEIREVDALRLADELERLPVAVECPGLPLLHDREPRLVVAVDEALGDLPIGRAIGQREDLGAVPGDIDDGHGVVRKDARDEGSLGQVFETGDSLSPQPADSRSVRDGASGSELGL
jgi:hypothetical protein